MTKSFEERLHQALPRLATSDVLDSCAAEKERPVSPPVIVPAACPGWPPLTHGFQAIAPGHGLDSGVEDLRL